LGGGKFSREEAQKTQKKREPEKSFFLRSLRLFAAKSSTYNLCCRMAQHQPTRNMKDIMELCDVVRETGFAIHRYHRHGHLEKVYENALAHRLRKLRELSQPGQGTGLGGAASLLFSVLASFAPFRGLFHSGF
jgi:hypothetical protein